MINVLPLVNPAAALAALEEVESTLAANGTLALPQLDNQLFFAVGGGSQQVSGYHHAWLRDHSMVAYSNWRRGQLDSAIGTVRSLQRFLFSQEDRMRKVVADPSRKEDPQERPHVRFNAETLAESDENWAHAQNDALADVMWMRLQFVDIPLEKEEQELLDLLATYFGAIEYWQDRDSGFWEEAPKVNSSSVGTVVAALSSLRNYKSRTRSFRTAEERKLDEWIRLGKQTLARHLPFESPPARKSDAALLFLIYPLQVVESWDLQWQIVSLVRARLEGPHGIRRYLSDSYFCQDYDEWFPPEQRSADFSNSIEVRDEFLQPGCEAQWCLFDPIISAIFGQWFRQNPGNESFLHSQIRYLNRSLSQVTAGWQCPELYYLKNGSWVPNGNTPLAWTQANLAVALFDLKANLIMANDRRFLALTP